MAQDLAIAHAYYDKIDGRSANNILADSKLTIERDGNIQICYAPFDHIEKSARLVIVGITPGMTQAVNALNALHGAKLAGKSFENALEVAKKTASFSGAMRSNLVEMMDYVGIAQLLNLNTTASVFEPGFSKVHFTSALRYPVFLDGANYNGKPAMLKTPCLKGMVDTHLAEEAKLLAKAIWLPLGPKPEEALMHLVDNGLLPRLNVLAGMPHPSPASSERVAIFTGRKAPELASKVTNAPKLLQAAERLKKQIANLNLGEAA